MIRSDARTRAATRCWASIGTLGGDRTCPILGEVAHCRECDVIAVAVDDLLARTPPVRDADADRTTDVVPKAEENAEEADARTSIVTFDVGGQALALDVSRVVEVGVQRPVRRVPHRTGLAFLGLVNVQGRLEPCFSLPAVLGLPDVASADAADPRLIVIGDETRRCSFYAHRVALRDANLEAAAEPPATVSSALDTHVRGILRLQGRLWSWLDADRLLVSLEARLR